MQIGGDAARSHEVPSIKQSASEPHGHTHCEAEQVPLKQPGNSHGVASHAATQTLPPSVTRHSKPGSHGQRPHGLPSPSRPEQVGVSGSPEVDVLASVAPVVVVASGPVDVVPDPDPDVVGVGAPVLESTPLVVLADASPVDAVPEPVAESVPKSGSGRHAGQRTARVTRVRSRRLTPARYHVAPPPRPNLTRRRARGSVGDMSEKLAAFLAASDRYVKAPARRALSQIVPMSPDFAKLVNLAGMVEAPRHVIIERLVADGARSVPHSSQEIRGSTLHVTIGSALTFPAKPNAVWPMDEVGKYGLAYAIYLGAPQDES